MRITYDRDSDAAYLRFIDGEFEYRTVRLNESVAVNIGPGERVVGIEVLDASQNLELLRDAPSIRLENLQAVAAS